MIDAADVTLFLLLPASTLIDLTTPSQSRFLISVHSIQSLFDCFCDQNCGRGEREIFFEGEFGFCFGGGFDFIDRFQQHVGDEMMSRDPLFDSLRCHLVFDTNHDHL